MECPACRDADLSVFFKREGVPLDSCQLLETEADALAVPLGDIHLGVCPACGFVSNTRFVGHESSSHHEVQAHSPKFLEFLEHIALTLIERHDLRNRTILEIGCGRGDFLELICRLGPNRGIGLDPETQTASTEQISYAREPLSLRIRDLDFDFVLCRHTLEHVHDVLGFVQLLAQGMESHPRTAAFFEVPNARKILEELRYWDVYFEHCSYFTADALGRLLHRSGFKLRSLQQDFDNQYLLADAEFSGKNAASAPSSNDDPGAVAVIAREFGDRFDLACKRWSDTLSRLSSERGSVVVWGSAPKAAAILTALESDFGIRYVININPQQHDKHVAGTRLMIKSPEFLVELRPTTVISLNRVYNTEISEMLAELGVASSVISL